jgi:hypothetical protein
MFKILKSKLFRQAFLLLLCIFFFETIAEFFYFHWEYWWYDVTLHFFGGVCVSMAFLSFWYYLFNLSIEKRERVILFAFIGVLTVGVLWEIMEIYTGATSFADGIFYVRDTVSDLLLDTSGGFFGTLYSMSMINKNR